jgi:gamma-glutamyltranspeptidase / glutathione hydrolase
MPRLVFVLVSLTSLLCLADQVHPKGALSTAHPLASAAGKEMLDAKGNAIDAAVAAALVLSVVGPYHSGLGGGGFAVFHLSNTQQNLSLDFREVAPLKATRDMFIENGRFVPEKAGEGALSIAVPGAIKGYLELQEKYGKLPRSKVFAPAIRIATLGFAVTPRFRDMALRREACLGKNPDAAKIFLRDGKAPALGTILKQPELAASMALLAKTGSKAFYGGELGRKTVQSVAAAFGLLSQDDLAQYATQWRAPLVGSYRGHALVTMAPPSAGGFALVQTLGILEETKALGPALRDVNSLHLFIEALRLSYADRAEFMGDPKAVEIPLERLLAKSYFASQAARINTNKAGNSAAITPKELRTLPSADSGTKNTSHISVIDAEGNAVALTTTLNQGFGSCHVAHGTGILLNDQMDDFTGQPGAPNAYGLVGGEANAIRPQMRPLSSMTPTLVFSKTDPTRAILAIGSPGGSTIPTTVMQGISGLIDAKLDLTRAIGLGRLHHQWMPDEVWVDLPGIEPATQKQLEALGHRFKFVSAWGDAQAVYFDEATGLMHAAADPRWEGASAGQAP